MYTTRTIDHGDGHIDIEAFFFTPDSGGMWCVVECNCVIEPSGIMNPLEYEEIEEAMRDGAAVRPVQPMKGSSNPPHLQQKLPPSLVKQK